MPTSVKPSLHELTSSSLIQRETPLVKQQDSHIQQRQLTKGDCSVLQWQPWHHRLHQNFDSNTASPSNTKSNSTRLTWSNSYKHTRERSLLKQTKPHDVTKTQKIINMANSMTYAINLTTRMNYNQAALVLSNSEMESTVLSACIRKHTSTDPS